MKLLVPIILLTITNAVHAQHLLFIPDTLSGNTIDLTVHRDSVHFKPGHITQTWGVNGSQYLGPTLILRKGDSVRLNVHNQANDTTTMHWHGLHVAAQNDGGPRSMIMPGDSRTAAFTVRNRASTYWYHPHMMMKTAEQAMKGDVGMLIVRDNDEAALALPRTYDVDDFPIIVQSLELDTFNQFMPKGMQDSMLLVNGTDTPYANMPAQVVRMRLLNASGERTFNFGFSGNRSFSIIGTDNGLLTNAVVKNRIRLSPGERAEVLLNLSGMQDSTVYLMSYASELPMGVQGGPTMPMPSWSPPMNSPLNGIDFNILQINVTLPTISPVTSIASALIADTPYAESSAQATRSIMMTADSLMVMDGPFYFNHRLFDMERIDYRIPLNNTEIWTLYDSTMVAHPFHLHDVHFYILDRNGVPPPAEERGRKDVLLIQSMETVRFIARFDDFADTTTPYMYHCHILMHEDDGMMGQFVVTQYPGEAVNHTVQGEGYQLFPNPATDMLTIATDKPATLRITDMMGRVMYTAQVTGQTTVATISWPRGMYAATITRNNTVSAQKLILR